jgi:hypothetical protein
MEGTPVGPNAEGVVIKRPDGSFTQRVGWTNFNQAALKEFAKSPQIKRHIEPLLEEEIDEAESKRAAQEITINTPPRVPRPDHRAGFEALFSSGLSVFMLLILYAANIYAAYEISIFKAQPAAVVCGVSAAVPVIGPLAFLCWPRRLGSAGEELAEAEYATEEVAHAVAAGPEGAPQEHAHAAPVHGSARATTTIGGHAPGPAHPPPQIYQRGQFTFNRRFFETKLAGFLRVVPSEAERDMVIHVRSSRGEYVATRIARITPEVSIPYNEVNEVRVQHKDA